MSGPVFDIELSKDLQILTVAHSNGVTFIDANTYVAIYIMLSIVIYSIEIVKSHQTINCKAYSSSLHTSKTCFITGGEDFKLYKFSYDTAQELG